MRMVLVVDEWSPGPIGGIGRGLGAIARAARKLGHSVEVIVVDQGATRSSEIGEPGVQVVTVADAPRIARRAGLREEAVVRAYGRLLEDAQVDLVMAPVWNTLALGLLARPQVPLVSMVLSPLSVTARFRPGAESHPDVIEQIQREERLLAGAPVVHYLSQHVRREVEATAGAPGRTWFVAPIPTDLGLAVGEVVEPAGPRGRRRLLFLGRLEPRKGIEVLLEAVDQLDERLASLGFGIDVVGDQSPRTASGESATAVLQRRFGGRQWWPAVRLHGHLDDDAVRRHLRSADAVCVPSLYESQGLVAHEALAYGRPLIVTDTGALADSVDGNGWVVPPGDVPALAAALEDFAIRPSLEDLAARSRQLARDIAPERLTRDLLTLASEALRRAGRGPDRADRRGGRIG